MTADRTLSLTLEGLTLAVAWVAIPLIMAGLVGVAHSMVVRAEEPDRRTAARAGWWAGLLLFLIYFVHSLPSFRTPDPTSHGALTLDFLALGVGAGLGFAVLWGLSFLTPARVGGVVVLLLTTAGLGSLHTYVFLEDRGEWLVAGVLGGALGALLHLIVFPGSLTGAPKVGQRAGDPGERSLYRG